MSERCMYIWKLAPILTAEGGIQAVVQKARRAKLSALWVKIADGRSAYQNVTGQMKETTKTLIAKCHEKNIQVWGWHVPHCATNAIAKQEVAKVKEIGSEFDLDGIIMDAEGGSTYFQGGLAEAQAYGKGMRDVADTLNKPLAISSNDIPQNLEGWLPRFNKIAFHADFNFPQVYYGGSPSVLNRLTRAENANSHVTIPFMPVGAAWIGNAGGCSSASACAERGREFIRLVHEAEYQRYSFWHWAGAPLAFWEMLNTTQV